MTTIADVRTLFEAQAKRQGDGYKTGHFYGFLNEEQKDLAKKHRCDCLGAGVVDIDWYMTRTAERKPVIRVQWYFPTYATRKVCINGHVLVRKTWACTTREQKFPFAEEGLEAAITFAKAL